MTGRGHDGRAPRRRREPATSEAANSFRMTGVHHRPSAGRTERRRNRTYRAGVHPSPLVLKTSRATRPRPLHGTEPPGFRRYPDPPRLAEGIKPAHNADMPRTVA